MSQPPLSDIVAALHLLLGDLDTDSRGFVLREAFPELILLVKGPEAERVTALIQNAAIDTNNAMGIVDGSSGLGHLAANNAAIHIKNANRSLGLLMDALRIRKPRP